MIGNDYEREFEKTLSFLDYHAAFENYEGVVKSKEIRESQKPDAIKAAEEFEEEAKTNEFKNNPLIDAIRKLREAAGKNQNEDSMFSSINLNKLIKENI